MSGGAVINGIGLCSSLGLTFAQSAAAYALGDANFELVDEVVGADGMPARLAQVFGFHEIHNLELRLQRLFSAAHDDLAQQTGDWPEPAGLRLIIPHWLAGNPIAERLQAWIVSEHPQHYASAMLVSETEAMVLGEAARALVSVNQGVGDALVVGALDSFMHAELLDILAIENRVLSKTQPHGVIPSEAAVLLRLCIPELAAGGAAGGHIVAVWSGREEEDVRAPKGILGRGLAGPFAAAVAERIPDRLLIDLNGERWRSEEIGFAISAAPPLPDALTGDFETPTLYTGFCGCATGGVMAALACAPGAAAQDPDEILADTDRIPDRTEEWSIISTSHPSGLREVAMLVRTRQPERETADAMEDAL